MFCLFVFYVFFYESLLTFQIFFRDEMAIVIP